MMLLIFHWDRNIMYIYTVVIIYIFYILFEHQHWEEVPHSALGRRKCYIKNAQPSSVNGTASAVTQCKRTVLRAAASECLTTSFATTFGFCGWLTDVSPLTFEDMKPSWSWAVSKILEWREEHSLHDGVMRTGWILHGCYKLRGWVLHLLRFASLIPIPMQGPKEDAVIPPIPPGQNLRSHWV